jgi:hypothetical protein
MALKTLQFQCRSLKGEIGAPRDVVLLNAAVTIAAFEGELALPIQERISKGLIRAKNVY